MKWIFPLLLLFVLPANGQQDSVISADTSSFPVSSVRDTTTKKYDVDTVVYANSSDSIIFFIRDRKMNLYGDGEMKYKDTDLKSSQIFVDFNTSNVEALGVKSDTARKGYTGTPVLVERGEQYEGMRMKYNFKTRRGYISSAGTEQEGSSYTGLKIKKVDSETYFIQDGIYTTCNLDMPHYHFYANEMKVIHKEQIVSKWIWLTFAGVPFPIPLPFAVFPIESGRRSGILAPAFGDDPNRGRYFSRFGYFWAINDYMDVNLTGDYYTKGSYHISSLYRYALRYTLSGSVSGGYRFDRLGEPGDPDYQEQTSWQIRMNHNQVINPTTRLDANLEFMSSSNYLTANTIDLGDLLRNEIRSAATLFKSWEESGNSMSLGYQRNQIIETAKITEILPSLIFNMSQKYPFRLGSGGANQLWFESFGYSYSGQFQNERVKDEGVLNIRGGFNHNVSLNFSPKVGYFNITPYFRYQERWYNKYIERYYAGQMQNGADSIVTNDVREINFVRTFNTGVSATTRFFGMIQPKTFGIEAIRHTVTPSISYDFRPDFSKPEWGYYDSYVNGRGEVVEYNKYERGIFGGPSAGEQQNIAFNVGNVLEMKTIADPTDTTSKQEKIQLLNLGASVRYNFAADSLRLSPLNIDARTQISQFLNLQAGSTWSFYQAKPTGGEINKFLANTGKGLIRLTNFNFSVTTSLSGERLKSLGADDSNIPKDEEDEYQLESAENKTYQGIYEEKEADFTIPWDISLTYRFDYNKNSPSVINKTSTLSGGLNFNLTRNWKFSMSGSYDLQNKKLAAPSVRISRDLHCWIMNFTWYPVGTYRGYQFEIRVKAPQLQDLKITKQDRFFQGK